MALGLFVLIFSFKLVIGKQEGFIVGGDYTRLNHTFPYAAFLAFLGTEGAYGCGATILNQYILITAAHCFTLSFHIHEVTASLGSLDKYQGNINRITRHKVHIKWNARKMSNDIALCTFKRPLLEFTRTVQRAILVKHPPEATYGEIASWGEIEELSFTKTNKQKLAQQHLWSHEECKDVIENLPEGTICGGEIDGEDYPSSGDAGCGLVINRTFIVGVFSCRNIRVSRSLAIYTNLSRFYDWIVRTSRELAC